MKKIWISLVIVCFCFGICAVGFASEEEISAKKLLLQIPDYAYTGEKESILTASGVYETGQSILSIFFYGLQRDGLIPQNTKYFENPPTKEQLQECPKVSAEDMKKTMTRLWGPDALTRFGELQDAYMSRGHLVLTRLEDGSYAYYQYSYGGGVGYYSRQSFLRSETVGEDVIVYSGFLQAPPVADWVFWIRGTVVPSKNVLIDLDQKELNALKEASPGVNPWEMIEKGMFDEYLPVYKHTFKPNGDGTYYWAQTELDTAGKEIPLSVFEEEEKYLQSLVATVPKEAYRGSVTDPDYQSHSKLTYSMTTVDDTLFISEVYAEWTIDGTSLVLYSPRGNETTGGQITLAAWENLSSDKNVASVEGLIRDERFVQYYTEYRHTFKENDDGTYTWVETIVNRYGREIPDSARPKSPSTESATSTNTASGTDTDLPTSDTQTNLPTESNPVDSSAPTDSGTAGDEESSPLWIYVTVGLAVAVVAALGIFFAVKKKKA